MELTQTLKPGQYMKTLSVLRFLSKAPIHQMNANKCEKHIGEYDVYFSTSDLKKIMSEAMFQEMECNCITFIIK
jgi:hypothetical protein